jgi:hypothetical protein
MKNLTTTIFATAALTLALGASAATVQLPTITTATAYDVEYNGGDLSFDKFNPSLGNLTSVQFELFNTVNGSIYVSNDALSGAPATFTITTGGQLDSAVGGGTLSTLATTTKVFTLAAGADSTLTLDPWTTTNSVTINSAGQLGAFTGPGTYHALLSGWSSDSLSGTGNASYFTNITMDGYAKVTYTYTTLPVPEPETYAMLLAGLGLVGAIARRRKSA